MKSFSISETAVRLNVGIQRVYSLIYSKKLEASLKKCHWVVTEAAIQERLERLKEFRRVTGRM